MSSTASTHSSMPPLESLSSSANDSGNASSNSNPHTADTAAQDTVKVIKNGKRIYFTNAYINNSCSRNQTSQTSEMLGRITHAMSTILQNVLLQHNLFIYFINVVLFYYVVNISGSSMVKKSLLSFNTALGNKA